MECGLVTAFIPNSVLSLYPLVSFTIAFVVWPPHHIQSPQHAADFSSAHSPPPLTHSGGWQGTGTLEEVALSPDELSLVVQATFSWQPRATLCSGTIGQESREEICSECNYRKGKSSAHSRFKIALAAGDVSIGRVTTTSKNDSKHFAKWNSQMMSELRLL